MGPIMQGATRPSRCSSRDSDLEIGDFLLRQYVMVSWLPEDRCTSKPMHSCARPKDCTESLKGSVFLSICPSVCLSSFSTTPLYPRLPTQVIGPRLRQPRLPVSRSRPPSSFNPPRNFTGGYPFCRGAQALDSCLQGVLSESLRTQRLPDSRTRSIRAMEETAGTQKLALRVEHRPDPPCVNIHT